MFPQQLLLDTGFSTLGREADDDFTTQFLHSPMFDSLREKVNTTIEHDFKNMVNRQLLEMHRMEFAKMVLDIDF